MFERICSSPRTHLQSGRGRIQLGSSRLASRASARVGLGCAAGLLHQSLLSPFWNGANLDAVECEETVHDAKSLRGRLVERTCTAVGYTPLRQLLTSFSRLLFILLPHCTKFTPRRHFIQQSQNIQIRKGASSRNSTFDQRSQAVPLASHESRRDQ